MDEVFNGTIAESIHESFLSKLGKDTSPYEVASWQNSLIYMRNVIDTPDLPDDLAIAIEYQIPMTAKRVDFMISGQDELRRDSLLIVELKQWQSSESTGMPGVVKTHFHHGMQEVAHPSYQAWSYAFMLQNYNQAVQEQNINLWPCAYLHNYKPDGVIDSIAYQEYIDKAPLFLQNDAHKLQDFIKKHIKYASPKDTLWEIENGRLKPSKQLADTLVSQLKGNTEFVLLDTQKVVYETALQLCEKATMTGQKQVFIVEGGPGTGKSVIAVNLLVELTRRRKTSMYVTKNSAPRNVYSAKLIGAYRRREINGLFTGSGTFVDQEMNVLDCLVVDEAHRLTLKSGMMNNLGENQIKEIINTALCSVFFIDDRQRIHFLDIGSVAAIQEMADKCGAEVTKMELDSQFRCNGSDGYISWIDNTLEIRETADTFLSTNDYDFRVYDSPMDLFNEIKRLNSYNNKSRVVAGYCWDWVSKSNPTAYDIVFEEFGFKKQWNLNNSNLPWLIDNNSIEQIGCIHTCQGLELDYVGVIIGNDIMYKDGQIVTDAFNRSNNDKSIRGFRSMYRNNRESAKALADEIIKNTYRTLMTRGMKGCFVYCCDSSLATYIRSRIKQ